MVFNIIELELLSNGIPIFLFNYFYYIKTLLLFFIGLFNTLYFYFGLNLILNLFFLFI